MEIKRAEKKAMTPHAHFTGQTAAMLMANVPPTGRDSFDTDVHVVHCEADSVSQFHVHPGGQVLYVIAGDMVAEDPRGSHHHLHEGDVVVTAPGELHRHGAAPEKPASLLAITWGGTVWTED